MQKTELIEALKETGIVSNEKDGNGIRLLLTVNDHEPLMEKRSAALLQKRLQTAQFWGIIITAFCLILSTIWGNLSQIRDVHYLEMQNYVLRISDSGKNRCFIPVINQEYQLDQLTEITGVGACGK